MSHWGVPGKNTLADFDRLMRHAEELMLVNKQIYYKDSSQERKHYSPEYLNRLLQDMEGAVTVSVSSQSIIP